MGSSSSRHGHEEEEEEEEIIPYDGEKAEPAEITARQKSALKCFENGDLGGLITNMRHVFYEKILADEEKERKEQERRRRQRGGKGNGGGKGKRKKSKAHSLDLANLKTVIRIYQTVEDTRGRKGKKSIEKELKMHDSDAFWLAFLKAYTWLMEGIVPGSRGKSYGIAGIPIPIASQAITTFQMVCTPLIMVGIPKWIHCPLSVMWSCWWYWFTSSLFAWIPFYGPYRYARRAPITRATQRLMVYLQLRKLMRDDLSSEEMIVNKRGRKKLKLVHTSKHMTQFLGREVQYTERLYKEIRGTWTSGCCCCW